MGKLRLESERARLLAELDAQEKRMHELVMRPDWKKEPELVKIRRRCRAIMRLIGEVNRQLGELDRNL